MLTIIINTTTTTTTTINNNNTKIVSNIYNTNTINRCAEKIEEAFSPALDRESVQSFIRLSLILLLILSSLILMTIPP